MWQRYPFYVEDVFYIVCAGVIFRTEHEQKQPEEET